MEALGLIETKGLIGAIESADAMLKAAEVRLLDRTFVTGGLVAITVTGDVAAVKAAVDAAAAAVSRLGGAELISQHVIPRPHPELEGCIVPGTLPETVEEAEPPAVEAESEIDIPGELHKADADKLIEQYGVEKGLEIIGKLKVVDLRNLAREYEDFGITGRAVSQSNKGTLLAEFENYYKSK